MNPPPIAATPNLVARHRIALWRLVFLSLALLLVLGTPAWSGHWLAALLRLGGIALVCAAAMGRMWCALYISGRKSRELVTEGPYSVCRHPLYLCNLLGFMGIALLSESLLAVALLGLAFAVVYPGVLASEERLLAQRFPAYDAYRRRTRALLPRWSDHRTSQEWTVEVRPFLRNLGDSLWFPLTAAAVELADVGHEFGLLGAGFLLY